MFKTIVSVGSLSASFRMGMVTVVSTEPFAESVTLPLGAV